MHSIIAKVGRPHSYHISSYFTHCFETGDACSIVEHDVGMMTQRTTPGMSSLESSLRHLCAPVSPAVLRLFGALEKISAPIGR